MLGHKANLSKFKKNQNHIKHLPQPQHCEIRNQPQEEKQKKKKKNCKIGGG